MEICRGIIVKSPKCVKTVGCEFKAYLEAMNVADTLMAVYDLDDWQQWFSKLRIYHSACNMVIYDYIMMASDR